MFRLGLSGLVWCQMELSACWRDFRFKGSPNGEAVRIRRQLLLFSGTLFTEVSFSVPATEDFCFAELNFGRGEVENPVVNEAVIVTATRTRNPILCLFIVFRGLFCRSLFS